MGGGSGMITLSPAARPRRRRESRHAGAAPSASGNPARRASTLPGSVRGVPREAFGHEFVAIAPHAHRRRPGAGAGHHPVRPLVRRRRAGRPGRRALVRDRPRRRARGRVPEGAAARAAGNRRARRDVHRHQPARRRDRRRARPARAAGPLPVRGRAPRPHAPPERAAGPRPPPGRRLAPGPGPAGGRRGRRPWSRSARRP